MSNIDTDMDDDKKRPSDSGNIVQEPENNDDKVEKEGEKVPPGFSFPGDAVIIENGSEDGEKSKVEDVEKSKDEDDHMNNDSNEVKDQASIETEPKEPAYGSSCEHVNFASGNEEPTNAKTDGQASPGVEVGKEREAKETVEQNATDGGVSKEKSSALSMYDENNMEDVEEKIGEKVEENRPEEISKLDLDNADNIVGEVKTMKSTDAENGQIENRQLSAKLSDDEASQNMNAEIIEVPQDEEMEDAVNLNKDTPVKDDLKEKDWEPVLSRCTNDVNVIPVETSAKQVSEGSSPANQQEAATPIPMRSSPEKAQNHSHSWEMAKVAVTATTLPLVGESDDGTPEEQVAFMKQIESFHRKRSLDFKPPKFYGKPLNCLKLWRAVIKLGGYDRVSACKLWRQVGESFHPPKTCTTVSWTFRIFYEKALMEYEKYKAQMGELQLPVASFPEASVVDVEGNGHQGPGSGRVRRDSATRAMQGWHVQRLFSSGEVGEPIIKDKNTSSTPKREKNLKSLGSLKHKRPDEVEHSNKAARTEISKQLVTPIVDIGPPADWVKINVRQTKDLYEIYALVPGLLREEVRVQTDPAGRVVITGQPEQIDNPWGITPFKKVVSLPSKIDPIQTSAVFSLHGRLLIRVPLEQPEP